MFHVKVRWNIIVSIFILMVGVECWVSGPAFSDQLMIVTNTDKLFIILWRLIMCVARPEWHAGDHVWPGAGECQVGGGVRVSEPESVASTGSSWAPAMSVLSTSEQSAAEHQSTLHCHIIAIPVSTLTFTSIKLVSTVTNKVLKWYLYLQLWQKPSTLIIFTVTSSGKKITRVFHILNLKFFIKSLWMSLKSKIDLNHFHLGWAEDKTSMLRMIWSQDSPD